MSAQIRVKVERGGINISTNVNQSVENARKGDVIKCESVDVHTTYSWTLVFTPDSPNGSVSSAGLVNPPGSTNDNAEFHIDNEGAYLIRLVVDAGLGTESTQFIRVRAVTRFGDLKLVAAGERKDSVGAIPADIDPVGWADNQNQNLQRLLAYIRRLSTSGRVLYVDANRGRKAFDSTQNANDPTNMLEMPGSDLSDLTKSGVTTDAEGFADFSDIGSAITYATQCASRGESALNADNPYVIIVQNGLYIEDVTLAPNVHLVSADNFFTQHKNYMKGVVVRTTNIVNGHSFTGTTDSDTVFCVGIEFENVDGASTSPTFRVQRGIAYFINSTISHKSGTGGVALKAVPVSPASNHIVEVILFNSFVQNTVANASDYAIQCGSYCGKLVVTNSQVIGQNGIQANVDYGGGLQEEYEVCIHRSNILSNAVNGYTLLSNAAILDIEHSTLMGSDATKILHIGQNLPKAGNIHVTLSFTEFTSAQITFDTQQVVGTTKLHTNACNYAGFVFPGPAPEFHAHTQAKSIKYVKNYSDPFDGGNLAVPVPNQLNADDVQDAIDELTFFSTLMGAFGMMNSLDVAYDGVVPGNPPTQGSGSGRKIAADQGAVVIQSATAPYATPPASSISGTPLTSATKHGYLQVEGNLEVGKVDSAEIDLVSNFATLGPKIGMGTVTWNSEIPTGTPRSIPSAIVQGNSDSNGLLHNYNMRVQTKSTSNVSNGSVGWVILQGGDSLEKGANAPHAGQVFIQGGSYLDSAFESVGDNCPAGSIYLIPGTSTGINTDKPFGTVKIVDPTASTSAVLLPNAQANDPTLCAGTITWATPMGEVVATIDVGMTQAQVIDAINNATVGAGLLFAQNTSGKISVTCVSKGKLSDVVYVADTGGVNVDIGDFRVGSGAVFTAGTDPNYVSLHSSGLHELTIGDGGAVGPMIYNSETGKLTVPGLIDPIGMIFSQTTNAQVPTSATEGAIFVSNGSDGLVADTLYYKPANNGTPIILGGNNSAGLASWSEVATNFVPNAAGTQDLGATDKPVGFLHINSKEDLTAGISWSQDYDGVPNTSGAWEQIHLTTMYAAGLNNQSNTTKTDWAMLQRPLANSLNTSYMEIRSFADLTTPGSVISWSTNATLTDVTNLESTVDFMLYSGNSNNTLFTLYKSTANTQDFQVRYEVPLALSSYSTAQLPTATSFRDGSIVFDTDANSMKVKVGNAWTSLSGGGLSNWSESGIDLVPNANGTQDLGSTTSPINTITIATYEGFGTGVSFSQDYNGTFEEVHRTNYAVTGVNSATFHAKSDWIVLQDTLANSTNVKYAEIKTFADLTTPDTTLSHGVVSTLISPTNRETTVEFYHYSGNSETTVFSLFVDTANSQEHQVRYEVPLALASYATAQLPTATAFRDGSIVFDTDTNSMKMKVGNAWTAMSGSGISLSDLSINTAGSAQGGGSLSYDNNTGVFTFTPADTTQGGGLQNWNESGVHLLPDANGTHDLGSVATPIRNIHLSTYEGFETGINFSQEYNGTYEQVHKTNYSVTGVNSATFHSKYEWVVLQDTMANSINRKYAEAVVFADLTTPDTAISHTVLSTLISPTNRETTVEFLHYSGNSETTVFSLFVDTANAQEHQVRYEVPLALAKYTTGNLPTATGFRDGSIVYDEDTDSIKVKEGNAWVELSGGGGISLSDLSINTAGSAQGGGALSYDNNTGVFTFTPADTAGGGIQAGGGQSAAIAIWTGTDTLNHNDQLTYDGANHTMFMDSTNGNQGTYTHYANSGDGSNNWLVGRQADGTFSIKTQLSNNHTTDGVGSLGGNYNVGWEISSSGQLIPATNGHDIGYWGQSVGKIYTNAISCNSGELQFHIDIGNSETLAWKLMNTGHLLPENDQVTDPFNNSTLISPYNIGGSMSRVNQLWVNTIYAYSNSIHFTETDGQAAYDWAFGVDTTDLTKPKLTFNGKIIGGDFAVVDNHSVATKYGSANTPLKYAVTVADKTTNHPYFGDGATNGYFIDGIESPALRLSGVDSATANSGYVYRFDQSDASNAGHPLRFYLTANKVDPTTAADNEYTTGVTTNGTPGQAGAYTEIVITDETPNILYYQCSAHQLMGNHTTAITNSFNDNGTVTSVGSLTGGGGFTSFTISDTAGTPNTESITDGETITFTNVNGETTVSVSGTNVTFGLSAIGGVAGSYTNANITVDSSGRITNVANGTAVPTALTDLGIADGTAGQVLQTDGNGSFSFADAGASNWRIYQHNTSVKVNDDGDDAGNDAEITFVINNDDKWKIVTGGHIIPQDNASYDIGNAEYKVRHLFLSDNSLKFVRTEAGGNTEFALGVDETGKLVYEGNQLLHNAIIEGDSGIVVSPNNSIAFQTNNVVSWGISNAGHIVPLANTYNLGATDAGSQLNEIHTRNIIVYDINSAEQGRIKPASQGTAIQVQGNLRIEDAIKFDIQTAYGDYSTDPTDEGDLYLSSLDETDKSRQRLVYNAPNLMWEGASDDTRTEQNSNAHIPMFAVGTERVVTLRVQDMYLKGTLMEHMLAGPNGDSFGDFTPDGTLDATMDSNGFFTSNTIKPIMRKVHFGDTYEQSKYIDFVSHVHLDDNVRGFGTRSYSTSGTKTPVVSFMAHYKGVEFNAGPHERGIRVGVYASYFNGSSWSNTGGASTINALSNEVHIPADYNEHMEYIELAFDEPIRLSELRARYGEVYIVIRAYFKVESGSGDAFIGISNVRLNLFSS